MDTLIQSLTMYKVSTETLKFFWEHMSPEEQQKNKHIINFFEQKPVKRTSLVQFEDDFAEMRKNVDKKSVFTRTKSGLKLLIEYIEELSFIDDTIILHQRNIGKKSLELIKEIKKKYNIEQQSCTRVYKNTAIPKALAEKLYARNIYFIEQLQYRSLKELPESYHTSYSLTQDEIVFLKEMLNEKGLEFFPDPNALM